MESYKQWEFENVIRKYGLDIYEECPCGSGKIIKRCVHENRKTKIEFIDECLRQQRTDRECLYEKCSNNAINSHTLSKASFLDKIIGTSTMIHLEPKRDQNGGFFYQKVEKSSKKLSLFLGFCDKHDSELFELLDNDKFSVENIDDLVLYVLSLRILAYQINFLEIKRRAHMVQFDTDSSIYMNSPKETLDDIEYQSWMIINYRVTKNFEIAYKNIFQENIDKFYESKIWKMNPLFKKIIVDSQLIDDGFIGHFSKFNHCSDHGQDLNLDYLYTDLEDNHYSVFTFPMQSIGVQRSYILSCGNHPFTKKLFDDLNKMNLSEKYEFLNKYFTNYEYESLYFGKQFFIKHIEPIYGKGKTVDRIKTIKMFI